MRYFIIYFDEWVFKWLKNMLSIAKYLDLMSIWSRSWQAFLIQFCWTSIYFLLCTMNFMRENGYRICKCMYLVTILWKKLFFILGCCECPADLDHYCWLLPFDCESHHLRLRIHRNSRYFFHNPIIFLVDFVRTNIK